MKGKRVLWEAWRILCAGIMAIAPGLSFAPQRKALPDATDAFGFLYQAVSRTFAAIQTDRLSLAVLFVAFWWALGRTLRCKPKHTSLGETLLCAGLSLVMTLYQGVKAQESVAVLWLNGFQVLKAGLFFWGIFLILLVCLRGLGRVLPLASGKGPVWRAMEQHPFALSLAVIALCWLPQLIVKYPGVLMWDTYQQIRQYIGEFPRGSNNPPLGTLIYGLVYTLGRDNGNVNLAYFLFTLAQTTAMAAALAWSLAVMRRLKVNAWVRYGALFLYAVSPCYAGWALVIGKDAAYLLFCLVLCVLLLEWVALGKAFFDGWLRPLALACDLTLLMLTRNNGALLAVPALLALLAHLAVRKGGKRQWIRFSACALATLALTAGGNALLYQGLHIQKVYLYDVFSLPFQMTARVVRLHGEELPPEEKAAIDRVLAYDQIGENYNPFYADAVKDTYRQQATAEDRWAYLHVWLNQLRRYPVDGLDALLAMNGVMFDPLSNYPMYVSLSDAALTDYVYPMSYNDMTLYDREALAPLNSAQRALTRWYDDFDGIPLLGLFATMGFCNIAMLFMAYLAWVQKRKRLLVLLLPALITAAGCLFSPVVYLRYALPMVCTLPFWTAGYGATGGDEGRGGGRWGSAPSPG